MEVLVWLAWALTIYFGLRVGIGAANRAMPDGRPTFAGDIGAVVAVIIVLVALQLFAGSGAIEWGGICIDTVQRPVCQ